MPEAQPRRAVIIRLDAETKATIQKAADKRGQCLNTFFIEAALNAADQTVADEMPGSIPHALRVACAAAARGGVRTGYRRVGWIFGGHVRNMLLYSYSDEDFVDEALARLEDFLNDRNGVDAWAWIERYFPKFAALIPERRCDQFLIGLIFAQEDVRLFYRQPDS